MSRVSAKNQITPPVEAMRAAGLAPGDEVTVRPVGDGELLIAARGSRVRRHAGVATGVYRPGSSSSCHALKTYDDRLDRIARKG